MGTLRHRKTTPAVRFFCLVALCSGELHVFGLIIFRDTISCPEIHIRDIFRLSLPSNRNLSVYLHYTNINSNQKMTQQEKTQIEERIVDVLKTVYDPEIPVNIYDLGLIYKVDVRDDGDVDLDMTFTAPSCPAADFILEDVRQKVDSVEGVRSANVNLVFEPTWDQSMMTEEARVELGFE